MKVSICTTTARMGFTDWQAQMLAQQTHKDLEWVLIDFAYERNVKTLQDLAQEIGLSMKHVPNVRDNTLFFRDITRNRNKALACATGDAVIFLDDYAMISHDFVERHLEFLERGMVSAGLMHRLECTEGNTAVDMAYANDAFGGVDMVPEALLAKYPTGKDFRDRNGQPYAATGITYTGNLGIPRTVFENLNGFDPRLESGLEDCDLGARAHTAGFKTVFNPGAWTINLDTGKYPYVYGYDHAHDVEPFISNPNNHFAGDATLKENESMTVEFHDHYRIAHCKVCGARGMIDPNELIHHKLEARIFETPRGLPGGYDALRERNV